LGHFAQINAAIQLVFADGAFVRNVDAIQYGAARRKHGQHHQQRPARWASYLGHVVQI
jgi:hypothetical protein